MKYRIVSLIFVLLFSTIYAVEEEKGFEISAGAGQYFYDDTRLDDASMGVLSLGYRFDET